MKIITIYNGGAFILFLGLLWMLLPHAAHQLIVQEDSSEHYIHLLEGLFGTLLGLGIMIWDSKRKKLPPQ